MKDSKYEEALERARAGMPIDEVFPELKESEDERIRKAALEGIEYLERKLGWDAIGDTDILDVKEYLERQKEQQPTAEEVLIMAGLKPFRDGNQWCILAGGNIQEGICGFGDTIDEALYQFLMEVLKIQKEQKPAEWSEEDEKIRQSIIKDIEFERNYTSATTDLLKSGKVIEKYNEQIAWLKSLRPQPQKEWTIEDATPGDILHTSSTASSNTFIFRGIRNDEHGSVECFCCYDSEDGFRKGGEEFIGWKTDRYRLATPEQCIELGRRMGRAGYIFSFETNQLRKLNEPHWKPSEEQMDALMLAYKDAFECPEAGVPHMPLKSLLSDLKKLL